MYILHISSAFCAHFKIFVKNQNSERYKLLCGCFCRRFEVYK